MAKGQQRGNREVRKPKKDKPRVVSESPFKAQSRPQSTTGSITRAKGKNGKQ